eukprot:SAG31_NODE_6628_length_1945_cov_2.103467_2_plen_140_part_00
MITCAPAPGGGAGNAGGAGASDYQGDGGGVRQQQVLIGVDANGHSFPTTCATLGGTLPADPSLWAALPHLQVLYLYNTRLSGTVPEALAALPALRRLLLQDTQVDAAQCRRFCSAHNATTGIVDACCCPGDEFDQGNCR